MGAAERRISGTIPTGAPEVPKADARGPILVFGMPRSGTTWLGKIFDSHPDTLYRHEPDSWWRLEALPLFPDAQEDLSATAELTDFLARLPRLNSLKVSGKLPLFPKSYLSPLAHWLQQAGVMMAKFGGRAIPDFPILFNPDGGECGQVRLVWKSIESVGRLGAILRALPDARAVVIVRHPCGQIASVLNGEARHTFTDRKPSSEDYGYFELLLATPQAHRYELTMEKIRSLEPIERLAWRWLLINGKAMEEAQASTRAHVISYEALCSDTAPVVKRAFGFSSLDWSSQTEQFIRASVKDEHKGYYSVFKDPQRSAEKWKRELSAEQIDKILAVTTAGPVEVSGL